jgi:hypothetical protein
MIFLVRIIYEKKIEISGGGEEEAAARRERRKGTKRKTQGEVVHLRTATRSMESRIFFLYSAF